MTETIYCGTKRQTDRQTGSRHYIRVQEKFKENSVALEFLEMETWNNNNNN